jgi:hypothetical protein
MAQNNADFGCSFVVKNANGTPCDLTGASLEMQWKNTTGAAPAASFKTTDSPATLVIQSPASAGIVTLGVPFATMQGLKSGLYYWDLLKLNSSTSRTLLGSGTLLISDGVTENPTARLPASAPLIGLGLSDIQLTAGNAALVLTLGPGGPPGQPGTSVIASAGPPPPPPSGFQFYWDTNDGWLKAISAAGTITDLASQ